MGLLHGSKHTRHTYRFDYYRRRIRCWTRFSLYELNGCPDVRFGSLADICRAKRHVRFGPNSDRESGFQQKVMSALLLKADMCAATKDVPLRANSGRQLCV
jgi:hypothetical protein